jgi:hypothetical protein
MNQLVLKVPDPVLEKLLETDLFYKNLEFDICKTEHDVPEPGRTYLKTVGAKVQARLTELGITL